MAEIKIEKKTTVWPWVLAGIVIIALLLLYFFYFKKGNDNPVVMKESPDQVSSNTAQAILAYTNYADSDTTSMGLDHEFTHTALIKLADATQYLADKTGTGEKADIDKAREYADKITIDPNVTTHADNIKKAAGLLSGVLSNIQKASYPDLSSEAEEVASSSEAIDVDELTLDQKTKVRAYFNNASMLLKKMN
ncbi:hypothetical protein ACFQZX_17470 [Mucilaginibacter litoreus]|uniref:Immunodominant membrane protein n=1 Tax=Mucilaginibacter litoreus TaxID=1048221 RepID=A0ABW3AWG7_9SPHI